MKKKRVVHKIALENSSVYDVFIECRQDRIGREKATIAWREVTCKRCLENRRPAVSGKGE